MVVAIGADRLSNPKDTTTTTATRMISQYELEGRLKEGLDESVKNVVMIQCVGARSPERKYCSRICCQTAVKNAMLIREANPQAHVSILYRDMQMYGVENETLFRDAKAKGVRFMYYDAAMPPEVGDGQVKVFHQLLGKEIDPARRSDGAFHARGGRRQTRTPSPKCCAFPWMKTSFSWKAT